MGEVDPDMALGTGRVASPMLSHLYPQECPGSHLQAAEWAPRPVWMRNEEKSPPHHLLGCLALLIEPPGPQ